MKRWRLEFSYDAQGRRISKSVLTGSGGSFVLQQSLVMLYDGWNMIAEIDTTTSAQLLRSYEWGMDVSGTMTGADGVGGLLIERFHAVSSIHQQASSHAPLYDGNGNVTELINLTDGKLSARYEYGAFGETISVDGGAVATANLFRLSTKYLDRETGFYNYTHRLYDPPNARWPSRDPIGERGGINLYGMVGNDPVNQTDLLGLDAIVVTDRPLKGIGMGGAINHYAVEYWAGCTPMHNREITVTDEVKKGVIQKDKIELLVDDTHSAWHLTEGFWSKLFGIGNKHWSYEKNKNQRSSLWLSRWQCSFNQS